MRVSLMRALWAKTPASINPDFAAVGRRQWARAINREKRAGETEGMREGGRGGPGGDHLPAFACACA